MIVTDYSLWILKVTWTDKKDNFKNFGFLLSKR